MEWPKSISIDSKYTLAIRLSMGTQITLYLLAFAAIRWLWVTASVP